MHHDQPFISDCKCNALGSKSTSCDESGRCQCIAYISGDKCNQCETNNETFPYCTGSGNQHKWF